MTIFFSQHKFGIPQCVQTLKDSTIMPKKGQFSGYANLGRQEIGSCGPKFRLHGLRKFLLLFQDYQAGKGHNL